MNKKLVLFGIFLILFIVSILIIHHIVAKEKTFAKIEYRITFLSDSLFSINTLDSFINTHCEKILNQKIDSVNRLKIQHSIEHFPYLKNVNVIYHGHTLTIKAEQEKAIARVFNNDDESYLIAASGRLMPVNQYCPNRILIANGNINLHYDSTLYVCTDSVFKKKSISAQLFNLYSIWKLADYIYNDDFWRAQICQMFITDNNEIELVPAVGQHVVQFGKLDNKTHSDEIIHNKFQNLKSIYINGLSIRGWNRYQSINLKYGSEIPCQKR